MGLKTLKKKWHLVWDSDSEIVVDYYQEDGKATTYYDDSIFEGFSDDDEQQIKNRKEEKKLKEKPDYRESVESPADWSRRK